MADEHKNKEQGHIQQGPSGLKHAFGSKAARDEAAALKLAQDRINHMHAVSEAKDKDRRDDPLLGMVAENSAKDGKQKGRKKSGPQSTQLEL